MSRVRAQATQKANLREYIRRLEQRNAENLVELHRLRKIKQASLDLCLSYGKKKELAEMRLRGLMHNEIDPGIKYRL
jgi:hypothetical protein